MRTNPAPRSTCTLTDGARPQARRSRRPVRQAITRFAVPPWRKEPSLVRSPPLLVRGKQLSTSLQDLQRPTEKMALDRCRASGHVTHSRAASTRDNRADCPGDARPVIPSSSDVSHAPRVLGAISRLSAVSPRRMRVGVSERRARGAAPQRRQSAPPLGGNSCLRLCLIRIPFSRVFGTLIERRQFGSCRPGVAAGNRRERFCTGNGTNSDTL